MPETKDKRFAVSISLTHQERQDLMSWASSCGLSLSAYLRMAAKEYALTHGNLVSAVPTRGGVRL